MNMPNRNTGLDAIPMMSDRFSYVVGALTEAARKKSHPDSHTDKKMGLALTVRHKLNP